MPLNAPRIFRSALLIEAAANIGTIIPLILNPETSLSYLVKAPSQITSGTTSLVQWLGAFIIIPTVPLLISYPEPTPSQPPSVVTARRRMTYLLLGVSEIALSLLTASQYISGSSGLSESTLLMATAGLPLLASMRAYVLFVKPEWMEAQNASSKVR